MSADFDLNLAAFAQNIGDIVHDRGTVAVNVGRSRLKVDLAGLLNVGDLRDTFLGRGQACDRIQRFFVDDPNIKLRGASQLFRQKGSNLRAGVFASRLAFDSQIVGRDYDRPVRQIGQSL